MTLCELQSCRWSVIDAATTDLRPFANRQYHLFRVISVISLTKLANIELIHKIFIPQGCSFSSQSRRQISGDSQWRLAYRLLADYWVSVIQPSGLRHDSNGLIPENGGRRNVGRNEKFKPGKKAKFIGGANCHLSLTVVSSFRPHSFLLHTP